MDNVTIQRDSGTVCYLVASYQSERQVRRLCRAIRASDPSAGLVVAHDFATTPMDASALTASGIEVVPARDEPIGWGSWAFVEQQLDALRSGLGTSQHQWFVMVSAQDYPAAPLAVFRDHLDTGGDDFLVREFAPPNPSVLRYGRRVIPTSPLLGRALTWRLARRAVNATKLLHVQVRSRELPPLLERRATPPLASHESVRAGNNWWVVSRRAATSLVERYDNDVPLRDHFRRTFIPSEGYVQTILLSDPTIRCGTDFPVQFTRWSGWSPQHLDVGDVEEALASGLPFARKFHEDDPALDALDEALGLTGVIIE